MFFHRLTNLITMTFWEDEQATVITLLRGKPRKKERHARQSSKRSSVCSSAVDDVEDANWQSSKSGYAESSKRGGGHNTPVTPGPRAGESTYSKGNSKGSRSNGGGHFQHSSRGGTF